MPGAQCTRGLACKSETSTRASSPKVHRVHPAFPHAMVLTVSFVLSPVIGLFCHRRLRIKDCLSPVGPTHLRKLDAGVEASGPHDFAVRSSISRQHAVDRSRANPPCDHVPAQRCRVHRIPPRVRDDRETPLLRDETVRDIDLIWGKPEGKYFWKSDWTAGIRLIRFNNSAFCSQVIRASVLLAHHGAAVRLAASNLSANSASSSAARSLTAQ